MQKQFNYCFSVFTYAHTHHHIHREMEQPPGDDAVALLAGFVMAAAR